MSEAGRQHSGHLVGKVERIEVVQILMREKAGHYVFARWHQKHNEEREGDARDAWPGDAIAQ